MLNVNRKNNGKYIIESISKGVFLASALIAVISLVVMYI